jgi:hypothetical protein
MWVLRTFAPSTMVRMVAAVPKGFAMTSEDARFVNEFIDSLFPVSPAGFVFDALSRTRLSQRLQLGGHQRADADRAHQGRPARLSRGEQARRLSASPGARFVSLESGGHLMIGQTKVIRDELTDFFAEERDRRAERVAS